MLKASLGRSVQQRPTNPDSADGKLSVLLPCYYVFSTTKMSVDVLQPTLIQSFIASESKTTPCSRSREGGDSAYERDGDARPKF